ncbi:MAG: hypothetical protein ACRDPM_14440 [Solirubrobacteraceae bacterium]
MQRNLFCRRPASAVLAALLSSVAIASCGGSSPSRTGVASTTNAGLKFAACVRAHGVPDFPDPNANPGGGGTETQAASAKSLSESPAVVQKADSQCRRYAAAAEGPVVSKAQLANLKAGALAYAKCVRAHGVTDFPDPRVVTADGGRSVGIAPPYGTGANAVAHAQSPTLQAAIKTCSSLVDKVTPGLQGEKG